ncbi:MAG: helicase C-terminal domain-containing protein [Candidatus Margulisbacteria bacterium]|nr:helicase C-terminal domain-containing protein [Candidatus Margulisiibacteriota bacterium]
MSCLNFVALDVETTGLDEKRNEITEIGIVRFRKGVLIAEYSTLVKPSERISDYVANMTGITNGMVSKAPSFDEVVAEMLDFIGEDAIVGHNIKFDIGMLNQALLRVNRPALDNVLLDTLDIISILNPTGGSFKLSYLAKVYGVLEENVHRAKDDSLMTANLYLKLIDEIKKLDKDVVSVLLYYLDQTDTSLKMIFDDVFGNKLEKHDYPWVSFKFNKLKKGKASERYRDESFKKKDVDALFQIFKEDGSLAKNLPGFEIRSAQIDMMEKVWQSFQSNTHLVVEAGTGTGKSLAYLLPAVYFALKKDKTVVVSTKTKALQEQLVDKDIPTLKKALGINFNEEMIKGKENYVCLNKFAYLMNSAISKKDDAFLKGALSLMMWVISSEKGDISEIHNSLKTRFNNQIKAETKSCLQAHCPFKQVCFLNKLKENAKNANIIVVNHALLLADIHYGQKVLPEFSQLIIDEAHTLEDVATGCFSMSFAKKRLNELFAKIVENNVIDDFAKDKEIEKDIKKIKTKFRKATRANNDWFNEIENVFKDKEKQNVFFKKSQKRIGFTEIEESIIDSIYISINDLIGVLLEATPLLNDLRKEIKDELTVFQRAFLRGIISEVEGLIGELAAMYDRSPGFIRWLEKVERPRSTHYEMIMTPLSSGELLQKELLAGLESVIHTSATISINGNFNYYLSRMGYLDSEQKIETAVFSSPFDLEKRMLLCVPGDVPAYKDDKEYIESISRYLKELLIGIDGKALVLFTSHKHLSDCYYGIKHDLEKIRIPLFCQGKQMSDKNLIKAFKEKEGAVLMGTDSFWEGIDVPGRNLSYVIVVKLPFDVPTDPIVMARMEQVAAAGRSSFFDYVVPKAIVKFKQGIGRLIRSKSDTGAVIILDKRVKHKGYGKSFINAVTARKVSSEDLPSMIASLKLWVD